MRAQIKAVNVANYLQMIQLNKSLDKILELQLLDKIINCLVQAAHYLYKDKDAFIDAQVCLQNADAIKNNHWKYLAMFYLQNFEKIKQPIMIAPTPTMHNHPPLWSGFIALVSENHMESALLINDHNNFVRLNSILYPDCAINSVKTKFVGAHTVNVTNIHYPPYFIPEYLPNPPEICTESVGYLLNTYTFQSINHTLTSLKTFWLPEQLAEIYQVFRNKNINEVQAALVSLHSMTHFLGSQTINHENKKSVQFLKGADEELRADSGSNIGLKILGYNLFSDQLIKAVILMDILDRTFKYILTAPSQSLDKLIISHHDAAAGQMRLNALRNHGALKKVKSTNQVFYYLDYQACLESDQIILAELETIDQLGLKCPNLYKVERLKFISQYLATNEKEGWNLDELYYEVRSANSWLWKEKCGFRKSEKNLLLQR